MTEPFELPELNPYDTAQPVGIWRRRGACDAFVQTAIGSIVHQWPEQILPDQLGYHLWHYWADGPKPDELWDELRMRFGSDFDYTKANNGEHPLHRLLIKNKLKAAEQWFQDAGWEPDSLCCQDTLWHAVAWCGDLGIFQMASQHLPLVNLNQQDEQGLTPAMIAVHRGGEVMVKHWLFLGADPDITDDTGKSLLHHIAQYGDASWFTDVQDMGANDKIRNDKNQTALDVLTDRMKHGTATDHEVARIYWARRYFQKTFL